MTKFSIFQKFAKNPIFALYCWLKLRYKYKSNACLLIIGDGPLKNNISKEISGLNYKHNEDTLQINWVPELSRYILISDLLLMPSSFEGMNLTLLECISYNKDIILSKFEGINEIKNYTKCCHQEIEFDEEIWAQQIDKILLDKSKYKSRNIINKKFISNFSDDECFKSFQKNIKF